MFTFHRIGFIDADEKEISSWMLLIETDKHMKAYLQYHAHDVIDIWMKIKASPEGKSGHTGNARANAYKAMLDIKMQREGKNQITMPDAINYIERVSSKTLINIFCTDGGVYVNEKGGCRDIQLRNDSSMHEQVFETLDSNDLVFPTAPDEIDKVKITNWPLCPHFYLSVNGRNIEVDGEAKWKTIEGANTAMKKFEKRRKAAKRRQKK